MAVYIARRILLMIPLLFGITVISFLVVHLAPGEPTDMMTDLNPKASLEAKERLRALIDERSAIIRDERLPTVIADGPLLVQLLQNLLSNAIKFQPQRTPVVQIGAKQDRDEWVFTVTDKGIGIDPQYFEKIFGMFQRLHASEAFEGSGIGLTICEKIVRLHGGRIWLESTVGEGSTFFFSLPSDGAAVREASETLRAA
jgi:chemotaxis family two-component system sensor kinase Cph1